MALPILEEFLDEIPFHDSNPIQTRLVRPFKFLRIKTGIAIGRTSSSVINDWSNAYMDKPETAPKILLVDDDDTLRGILQGILKSRGYHVIEASDCTTALSMLRTERFNLVLLDITLPDRSGFDVLTFVNENHLPIKVIMITGTIGLENAVRSVTLGAEDYISKPYNPNYLLRSIEHALTS